MPLRTIEGGDQSLPAELHLQQYSFAIWLWCKETRSMLGSLGKLLWLKNTWPVWDSLWLLSALLDTASRVLSVLMVWWQKSPHLGKPSVYCLHQVFCSTWIPALSPHCLLDQLHFYYKKHGWITCCQGNRTWMSNEDQITMWRGKGLLTLCSQYAIWQVCRESGQFQLMNNM